MKQNIARAAARELGRSNVGERRRERGVLRVQLLLRAEEIYRGPGRRVSLGGRTKSDLERDQRKSRRVGEPVL